MIYGSASRSSTENSDANAFADLHVNLVLDVTVAPQNDGSIVPPYPESVRAELISSTSHNGLFNAKIDRRV
jgi:hypothetical protein